MEIDALHKYIHLNKLANDTLEVLYAGQPALVIGKFSVGHPDDDASSFHWTINPVFAKLTYGANVATDVPYCLKQFDTPEEATADGLAKLHSLGAFNTEVDLPDDTYAAAQDQVSEDIRRVASSVTNSIFEASVLTRNILANKLTPKHKIEEILESVQSGQPLSKDMTRSLYEHTFIHTPLAFNQVTGLPLISTKTVTVSEGKYKPAAEVPLESVKTAVERTEEPVVVESTFKQFLTRKRALKEARDSEFTAYVGMSGAKIPEPINGKVKIKSPTGKILSHHATETDAIRTFKMMKDTKGVKIQRESEDGSEVDITHMISEEDSEEEIQARYDKWVSDVKAKHGSKPMKFKGRVEQGVNTVSAEKPGGDHAYGIWDHDKNEGHVFESETPVVGAEVIDEKTLTEPEIEKREEIVKALKKTKGFVAKYGKDAAFAIATAKAKELS
jgi:hypothetical protein